MTSSFGKPDGPGTLTLAFTADELVRRLLSLDESYRLTLLDSGGLLVTGGRYLIAGLMPNEVLTLRNGSIERIRPGRDADTVAGALMTYVDQQLAEKRGVATDVTWTGAVIGSFSYEFGRNFELPRLGVTTGANEIEAQLAFYDSFAVHDYASGESYLVGGDRLKLRTLAESIRSAEPCAHIDSASIGDPQSNFSRTEYEEAVGKIKEYIAAGDIYQANLTQQFSVSLGGTSPEAIFLRLRREHPAPFGAFIRRTNDVVVSGSPERFLRVTRDGEQRAVEAWPIKGTRPRGKELEADAALGAELLASAKDRAENVMIVDLLRNDLGRVAAVGSVRVEELCTLQEHPSLFHLVSKIRATMREDATMGDLMRAAFPCGSITGAPKIRAMEIIHELEPSPRGLSMGAIGYFGFDGTADLSVAIRTMTIRDGVARFNVGGGIVADSDPAAEYEESLVKARALMSALAGKGEG